MELFPVRFQNIRGSERSQAEAVLNESIHPAKVGIHGLGVLRIVCLLCGDGVCKVQELGNVLLGVPLNVEGVFRPGSVSKFDFYLYSFLWGFVGHR